jgi:hypothetical protein
MKDLLDDYKRRLATIEGMIAEFKSNGSEHDIRKDERFKTKASEYRTMIVELERVIAKTEPVEDSCDCETHHPEDWKGEKCRYCHNIIK